MAQGRSTEIISMVKKISDQQVVNKYVSLWQVVPIALALGSGRLCRYSTPDASATACLRRKLGFRVRGSIIISHAKCISGRLYTGTAYIIPDANCQN